MAALLTRLRPTGPWRTDADRMFHSDTLYGALTSAMAAVDSRDEWLAATAQSESGSAVRVSSLFPWQDELLYVVPPQTIWPLRSGRFPEARFAPLPMVASLLAGEAVDEEKWSLDPLSLCLVPPQKQGPFRGAMRTFAAVDRITQGSVLTHSQECLEFRPRAGFWCVADFANDEAAERWSGRLKAAFRYLADSGLGAQRTQGWGHFRLPEFREGTLAELLGTPEPAEGATAYWLLSLYSPAEADQVAWDLGHYSLLTRAGRVMGSGATKRQVRMVAEGSVVVAADGLRGQARDVAPEGYAHPVYQAGFALAVRI